MATDPYVFALEIAFGAVLTLIASLLLVTYLAFVRMNKDVRRARMFIMADRVKRFLGAFTIGFLAIAAEFVLSIVGIPVPTVVSGPVIFLFMGTMLYGTLELFLIIRPRPLQMPFLKKASARPGRANLRGTPSAEDPPEGEGHAAR